MEDQLLEPLIRATPVNESEVTQTTPRTPQSDSAGTSTIANQPTQASDLAINCSNENTKLEELIIESSLLDAINHQDVGQEPSREEALRLKKCYHSCIPSCLPLFRWSFIGAAFLLLTVVPFLEHRSSFSSSSSYSNLQQKETSRFETRNFYLAIPIATETILLIIITVDACLRGIILLPAPDCKSWLKTPIHYRVYVLSLTISWIALTIGIGVLHFPTLFHWYAGLTITRQLLRPVFLIAQVVVIKKAIKAILYTTLQLFTAFVLLFLVMFLFVMIALVLFPHNSQYATSSEGDDYFNTTSEAFWSLIVFLSTANSPDIMTPAYKYHRAYFLFFGTFFFTLGYLLLNFIVAMYAIRFRSFLKESMERTYENCIANLAKAFLKLPKSTGNGQKVEKTVVDKYAKKVKLVANEVEKNLEKFSDSLSWDDFKSFFMDYIFKPNNNGKLKNIPDKRKKDHSNVCFLLSITVTVIHSTVLCVLLTIDYKKSLTERHSNLVISLLVFSIIHTLIAIFQNEILIISLTLEIFLQCASCVTSICPERYKLNQFKNITSQNLNTDVVTAFRNFLGQSKLKQARQLFISTFDFLVLIAIIASGFVHIPCLNHGTYDNCLGIENLITLIQMSIVLVTLRMLRMIMKIPSFRILIHSLLRILIVFIPFIMLAYILYYEFAIIGMAAFRGTNLTDQNAASDCGSYENLEYDPYNFEDFGSSLVLLWNLMIVNNWHIIVDAYVRRYSEAVRIYFTLWWLISETIITGILLGISLEVLTHIIEKFFLDLEKELKGKSFRKQVCLVLQSYFWWGNSVNTPKISWNVFEILNEDAVTNEKKTEIETEVAQRYELVKNEAATS